MACCCQNGSAGAYRVTVGGITDGTCYDCEALNGVYIFTKVPTSQCTYDPVAPSSLCGASSADFSIDPTCKVHKAGYARQANSGTRI